MSISGFDVPLDTGCWMLDGRLDRGDQAHSLSLNLRANEPSNYESMNEILLWLQNREKK